MRHKTRQERARERERGKAVEREKKRDTHARNSRNNGKTKRERLTKQNIEQQHQDRRESRRRIHFKG